MSLSALSVGRHDHHSGDFIRNATAAKLPHDIQTAIQTCRRASRGNQPIIINIMDGGIIMGKEDVPRMVKTAPNAKVVVVHMDAVNHATVTSDEMRQLVKEQGLQNQVAVPREGEILKY
ncbi:hypothetical protein [Haemophilus paracuniculus]|uniref:hypothetical protein n=1 Tax=Haemophilus paracuniculus TaxID=734 RepID=UPI001FE4D420|nr:hypothetical protein [Haemophilus paracuniculus]